MESRQLEWQLGRQLGRWAETTLAPSMQAIVRRPDGGWSNTASCKVTGEGAGTVATSPQANGGAAMTCYCCCPLPYDALYTSWLAVFGPAIGDSYAAKPMHADDMPFPLFLPLYPHKDLLLLAFRARRGSEAAPPTVYMHFPSPKVLHVLAPFRLTVELWKRAAGSWQAALKTLSIGSWLSYAFDGLWAALQGPDDAAAADMYIEQECTPGRGDEEEEDVSIKPRAAAPPAEPSSTSSSEDEAEQENGDDSDDPGEYSTAQESSEEEEDEDEEAGDEDGEEEGGEDEDGEDDKEEF